VIFVAPENELVLIDTHAHLDFGRFKRDREQVIERAVKEGVKYIVNIGADLKSSYRSVELARSNSNIFATVGIHPHDADQLDEKALQELKRLSQDENVSAIGEIGLDYHYDNSPRDIQKAAFREQLLLAKETGLPVVIHSREADEDTLKILQELHVEEIGGIMHCFGSGLEMARECLDLNLYLAFGGVITFGNAVELRKVVQEVPLERILLETDCPYLTPEPFRGRRNEPAYVKYVAEKIARLKGLTLEEIAEATTTNAKRIYGL
jgi:TatD DNase family protein